MKVRFKLPFGERVALSDIPIGEPFALYRWQGQGQDESSDDDPTAWVRVDGVASVKREYYKTAQRVKDDMLPILSLETYRVHLHGTYLNVHPLEYVNEPTKKR